MRLKSDIQKRREYLQPFDRVLQKTKSVVKSNRALGLVLNMITLWSAL